MLEAILVVVQKSHAGFLYTPCKKTTNIKGGVATTVLGSGSGSSSTRGDSLQLWRTGATVISDPHGMSSAMKMCVAGRLQKRASSLEEAIELPGIFNSVLKDNLTQNKAPNCASSPQCRPLLAYAGKFTAVHRPNSITDIVAYKASDMHRTQLRTPTMNCHSAPRPPQRSDNQWCSFPNCN